MEFNLTSEFGSQGEQPHTQKLGETVEIGVAGVKFSAGQVMDDWLPELHGTRGRKKWREMKDGDPTIGALLTAIEMMLRAVDFRFEATEADIDGRFVEFAEEQFDDMENTWDDVLTEVLTMLPFGFSFMEMVFKRREDGLITTAKIAPRYQETIYTFDIAETGELRGVWQMPPFGGQQIFIPADRLLHFRTRCEHGNPEGKALCPDTDIPTPDGWRIMSDLKVGDKIFDEQGKIRYITGVKSWEDRQCYKLHFSDGFSVVADENHEWFTRKNWERSKELSPVKRTTKEIFETQKTANDVSNHSIDWAEAVDYPEQILPIHPYVLGMWLGDGHSRSAMMTCHEDDVEETKSLIEACGYPTEDKNNGTKESKGRLIRFYGKVKHDSKGPSVALRMLNLYQNKHIPEAYLRGSKQQRLDLLSGLMDSDGSVDQHGRCEFVNTNENLADGVAELIRSLGIGAFKSQRKPQRGFYDGKEIIGRHCSHHIKFTPTWPPFKLKRKAAKCKLHRDRMRHYIKKVEKLPKTQKTICIEVDSPSHMFLAGRGMVPTHNSILRNAYKPYFYLKNIEMIEAIAIERELNGLPVVRIPAAAMQNPEVLQKYEKMARDVKFNEQGGIVMPSNPYVDPDGKPMNIPQYELTLISAEGSRAIDTGAVITRKQQEMVRTVLADFLMLGAAEKGSFALSKSKTDLFLRSIQGYLNIITSVFNKRWMPTLWDLNGFSADVMPKLVTGNVAPTDLAELGAFIRDTGIMAVFDQETEDHLFEVSGLPKRNEGDDIE